MENSEKGTPTEFGLKILQKLYQKIAPSAAQIQPHQTLLEEEKFSQQKIGDILKNIPKDISVPKGWTKRGTLWSPTMLFAWDGEIVKDGLKASPSKEYSPVIGLSFLYFR
ncbi:hypothetical protein AVEN_144918-1 [Araneus ventricosus]|uniref:Uncharacterized protein n=1 Tax=Araneus ventricosus TaxID=182803 RepID=A0A4Y2CDY6_ARAVE|nr:hypothetical protein AVEN_42327-1 [Araneus ventricosus]GBM02493.1 hypothetical protein AVEN_144918-1 [Araneus ventricosus]